MRFARRLQLVVGDDEQSARWREASMAWPELEGEHVEPLPIHVAQGLAGPELEAELPAEWTQQRGADTPRVAAASTAPPAARPVRRFVPAAAPTHAASAVGSRPLESHPARIAPPASRHDAPRQDRVVFAPDTAAADTVAPAVASQPAMPTDVVDGAVPLLEALLSVAERPTATPRTAPLEMPPVPAARPRDQVVAPVDAPGAASPPTAARPEQPAEVDGGHSGSGDAPRVTLVIDEPRAVRPTVGDDRLSEPARVFVAPNVPNDVPMPRESVSDVAAAEPTRRVVPAPGVPPTQDAPALADAVVEGGDVDGEPDASEDVAGVRAAPSPAPDASAPVTAEALPAPNEPAARASRRSRVEELPAEPLPPRREAEQPGAKRGEPTAAGRTASGARKSPDTESETAPADQLFRPLDDGVDRTPAALGARLFAAFAPPRRATSAAAPPPRPVPPAAAPRIQEPRPATDPQNRRVAAAAPSRHAAVPPRPDVTPVPTPPDTARILTPLVGIDPSTVTVLQGPDATAATAAARADALAIGSDTVVVGPTFTGSTPRDVGLLAHELTHVARAREPRFVPPVARPVPRRGVNYQSEEDVARRVEVRVATGLNGSSPPRVLAEAQRLQPPAAGALPEPHAFQPPPHADADEPRALPAEQEGDHWGGLPAPWEPLPQWLVSSPSASREGAAPLPSSEAPGVASQSAMVSSWVSAAPSPVVHAADESRTVDAPAPSQATPPAAASGDEAGESGPDLDWLARQVYSALKRRLGAEARRENLL